MQLSWNGPLCVLQPFCEIMADFLWTSSHMLIKKQKISYLCLYRENSDCILYYSYIVLLVYYFKCRNWTQCIKVPDWECTTDKCTDIVQGNKGDRLAAFCLLSPSDYRWDVLQVSSQINGSFLCGSLRRCTLCALIYWQSNQLLLISYYSVVCS